MLLFFIVTGRMTNNLQVPPTGLGWYLLFVLFDVCGFVTAVLELVLEGELFI